MMFFLAVLLATDPAALTDFQKRFCEMELRTIDNTKKFQPNAHGPAHDEVVRIHDQMLERCLERARKAEDQTRVMREMVRRNEAAEAARVEASNRREKAQAVAQRAEDDDRDQLVSKIDELRQDGPTQQLVQSLAICGGNEARAGALVEIAKEKRYSKRVGAVNLSKLEALKSDLRDAEEQMDKARSVLKALGLKPLKCSDSSVDQLSACIASPSDEPCRTYVVRARMALFAE